MFHVKHYQIFQGSYTSGETFFSLPGTLIMLQTTNSENQFVIDILMTLRNEKFSPLSWVHFLGSSWKRSCATARANPVLKRSWTQTQSKLGQIADCEADFCLYFAISLILIQNNILPLWFGLVILLRFMIPFFAAIASYFLFAHPVRFGSTIWGKVTGLALCSYFLILLAPVQLILLTRLF